ncbi:DUF3644 domain-containing protein [Nitratireductor sp.]|uniref:DUF3644 domain-containing protein n=1 Tax=Nitratireductor sp. TaxID=1872084 RepID=UPI00262166EA|nr:DUF3644 domain-containing protein [Nitratireductor sp.]MCV0378975.1 DUF3644 domain-containing protein [Nitratireductor sp.]
MMVKGGGLTALEKRIVKALLARGERNQDIHALINYERTPTVNFGRISGVKKDKSIEPASDEEVEFFKKRKQSFDPVTGLNLYGDERLIRAREAMILAVTIFNSSSYKFKTGMFAILANIAWTYLLHEYYHRKDGKILNSDGTTFGLSYMLTKSDCPLSKGIKNNLNTIKAIRDEVEHRLMGRSDPRWLSVFQACCLNFDKTVVDWYGPRLSLQNEISVALQFGKLQIDQAAQLHQYDVPPHIAALDARLTAELSEEDLDDLEYQFRVVYTFDSASKGSAHIQFLTPDSAEGKSVHNVLQKYKISDELYPYKPSEVAALVSQKSCRRFTVSDHTEAWKRHKVRPAKGDKTNRTYCIFHKAYNSYTYNDAWLDLLVNEVVKPPKLRRGDTEGDLFGAGRAEMREMAKMIQKARPAPAKKAVPDGAAKA